MWNDYFYNIQNKYNMRVSTKAPLVIRLDGKDTTKDTNINLLYNFNGGFSSILEKCAWYFTKKYNCYAIFGTDEISFVFPEPMILINDLEESNTHSNEIIALFTQYFFDYFNLLYKDRKVFFHAKCFSIPKTKLNSYILYRSKSIKNVITTYLLKKNNMYSGNLKLEERIEKCKELEEYKTMQEIENGTLYFNGDKLDILEFLNGNKVIVKKDELNNKNKHNSNNNQEDIEFLDIDIN